MTETTNTPDVNVDTSVADPAVYLELVKQGNISKCDEYLQKHFGEIEHNEQEVETFARSVMDLVDKEAEEAMVKQAAATAEQIKEETTSEVQATNTDSESTN